MSTLWQDLRYGARMLWKKPGFTLIAVFTLALGIGANTAIFSVVNAVLLRPLPFKEAERLVWVVQSNPQVGETKDPLSAANFADYRARNQVFEQIAASRDAGYNLTEAGEPEALIGYRFSADFFSLLGVKPALGRTFVPEEDQPGNHHAVVLSDRLWQRRFGADQSIIGKKLKLNDESYTVIGVMPPGFQHPSLAELWTPLALDPKVMNNRERRFLRVMARLKPGITLQQAQAEMETLARRLEQDYPAANSGWSVSILSVREERVKDVRPLLLILFGAVGFVLLIACANVANLLLARATARQKEIALRAALGASRGRIVRQLLTEGVVLSLAGGAAGLLLAWWSVNSLFALFPRNILNTSLPRVDEIPVDAGVLGFTLLLSLVSGVVFGLMPALQAAQTQLYETLKEGGRSTAGGLRGRRFRSVLTVSEVALALVLLVGAGLMIKSFLRLRGGALGFNPEGVLTLRILLPFQTKYRESQQWRAFFEQALGRIETLDGVQAVGAVNALPLSGAQAGRAFAVAGRTVPPTAERPEADFRVISPTYFRTMNITLVKGREFNEQDREGAVQVAVINQAMAQRYWPAEDPLGKRLIVYSSPGLKDDPIACEVVGVMKDVKHFGLERAARPEIYRPFAQEPWPLMSLVVRTTPAPMRLANAVRREVWAVDKDQPVSFVMSLEQLADESVAARRVSMLLLVVFAALALLLAMLGIYGVLAYSVTQRRHEIGIRMALGAQPGEVLRLVIRQGMKLALIGVALGLVASLALTRLMKSLLFGVSATDPLTFVMIALLLTVVALLACWIPARRATKVDPMVALRCE